MFKRKKKEYPKLEEKIVTVKHKYTLNIDFKNCKKPYYIWYTYDASEEIPEIEKTPFDDFITWYELKLNKLTYKFVGNDFITIINRDNIAGIGILYKKIEE